MSRESLSRYKNRGHSSSEQSLPEQWGSIQKRLDYVETVIAKLQKRNKKLQKKIEQQNDDINLFKKDTIKLMEQALSDTKNNLEVKQKQLELQNMKAELEELHSFIKRIQKKNNQMIKEIKNSANGNLNESFIEEKIEEKVQKLLQSHQKQTERAIAQLKRMIKDFNKPLRTIQKKNEEILSNSRSKLSIQKSASRIGRGSYTDLGYNPDASIQKPNKCKSPPSPQAVNTGNSRVNYLREKLKEFEETNKKYQEKLQKKGVLNNEDKKTVQKMKDFKNYLEQSQSQLDQSNLQAGNVHNVLTDSIKNWKGGQKHRYQ